MPIIDLKTLPVGLTNELRSRLVHHGFASGEESDVWAEFCLRIEAFVLERLILRGGAVPMFRSLEAIVYSTPKRHDGIIPRLNHLTMVWAAILLCAGFRGLTHEDNLDNLKEELVRLLVESGYRLPPKQTLFCPMFSQWNAQRDWGTLSAADTGIAGDEVSPLPLFEHLPSACQRCKEDALAAT